MTQDVPVTFLEVPVVGRPVRILHNRRDDYTAPVIAVTHNPTKPDYYRVITETGVTCVGSYAPTIAVRQHSPAPPQQVAGGHAPNARKRPYALIIGVILFILVCLIGAFVPDSVTDDSSDDASIEAADGSNEKKREAWDVAQDFVRDSLKAPSTASFPDLYGGDAGVNYDGDQMYSVGGYVDAENSFGAHLRTKFVCKLRDGGEAGWFLVDMQLDE